MSKDTAINQPRQPNPQWPNTKSTGFKTTYEPKVAEDILNDIATVDLNLVDIYAMHGVPQSTWHGWKMKIPGLSEAYARALKSRADVLYERHQGRHEQSLKELRVILEEDGADMARLAARLEDTQSRRLQWDMERINPERFGHRVNVDQRISIEVDQWQQICTDALSAVEADAVIDEDNDSGGKALPDRSKEGGGHTPGEG